MNKPVHPGRVVRNTCLQAFDLNITQAAKLLGVTRLTLSKIVNEKSGISPDMAIRLSKAFGSTPETWLQMQLAHELAVARKHEAKIKVKRFEPAHPEAAA